MGKKITVYLTDEEFRIMEALCDHKKTNMSRILKTGLKQMFSDCALIMESPVREHLGAGSPVLITSGQKKEMAPLFGIDIYESELDKKKRLEKEALEEKKAKARREADEFFKKTFSNTPLVKKRGEKK